MQVYGLTDTGQMRVLNEDSYSIYGFSENEKTGFCIVADGMGGHNAGEVASGIAVEYIRDSLKGTIEEEKDDKKIKEMIVQAVKGANTEVYKSSLRNQEQSGMGTTVVVVYVYAGMVYIASVGDSRAYLIENENIRQMTVDHSVVEELIARGTITREESAAHPQRHVITRALGTDSTIEVDMYEYEYKENDIIIMCTDGLTDMLSEEDIKETVYDTPEFKQAVCELVKKANDSGGTDNVTVIAVKFDDCAGE